MMSGRLQIPIVCRHRGGTRLVVVAWVAACNMYRQGHRCNPVRVLLLMLLVSQFHHQMKVRSVKCGICLVMRFVIR